MSVTAELNRISDKSGHKSCDVVFSQMFVAPTGQYLSHGFNRMALDGPTVAARIFATVTIRAMPILRLIGRFFVHTETQNSIEQK